MRWLFLLLLVLNIFYAVWRQQEAPTRPVEIQVLSLYKGGQPGLRLLSESGATGAPTGAARDCLYVGGYPQRFLVEPVQQRLIGQGVRLQAQVINGDQGAVHWLRIEPQSQRLLDDAAIAGLSRDFNDLKHQIMPCEGIATDE